VAVSLFGIVTSSEVVDASGLPAISETTLSPIMIVGACVQALRAAGMIEASMTRRPSMPLTRSCGSTTAVGSVPMRRVHGLGPGSSVMAVGEILLARARARFLP
jgi:hypothetical protein